MSTNRITVCVQENYHACVVAPLCYTGMLVSLPESDKQVSGYTDMQLIAQKYGARPCIFLSASFSIW